MVNNRIWLLVLCVFIWYFILYLINYNNMISRRIIQYCYYLRLAVKRTISLKTTKDLSNQLWIVSKTQKYWLDCEWLIVVLWPGVVWYTSNISCLACLLLIQNSMILLTYTLPASHDPWWWGGLRERGREGVMPPQATPSAGCDLQHNTTPPQPAGPRQ